VLGDAGKSFKFSGVLKNVWEDFLLIEDDVRGATYINRTQIQQVFPQGEVGG
jgi:hypothetical protein